MTEITEDLFVTYGQVEYERNHLVKKLINRDIAKCNELINCRKVIVHPLFSLIEGKIEKWEKIK